MLLDVKVAFFFVGKAFLHPFYLFIDPSVLLTGLAVRPPTLPSPSHHSCQT